MEDLIKLCIWILMFLYILYMLYKRNRQSYVSKQQSLNKEHKKVINKLKNIHIYSPKERNIIINEALEFIVHEDMKNLCMYIISDSYKEDLDNLYKLSVLTRNVYEF